MQPTAETESPLLSRSDASRGPRPFPSISVVVCGLARAPPNAFAPKVQAQEYYEDAFQRAIEVGDGQFDMAAIDVTGLPCVEVDTADDYATALQLAGAM